MRRTIINISEKYKYFAWMPERTGSNHFTKIIDKLGFQSATIEDNKIISYNDKVRHNHFCGFFENHWDYKFLICIRNPYAIAISRSGAPMMEFNDETLKIIRARIENNLQSTYSSFSCCNCFNQRKPDFAIRLEFLYEDWIKVPFVSTHSLNISGELKELTKTRINNQKNTEDPNYWKKYYNQSLSDFVYYNNSETFKLFGYDKDSWKS